MTAFVITRGFPDDEVLEILVGNFLCLFKAVLKPQAAMDALGLPRPDARAIAVVQAAG